MITTRSLIALSVTLVMLAACGDVRESLGLGRNPPDEFAVIDRPPLSMPPDFGLRPPKPGAPRPQELDMTQRANDVLFGEDNMDAPKASAAADGLSDAEKSLLEQANAANTDPQIRTLIDHETSQRVVASPHLIDQVLWWKKDKDGSTVVDAPAEAARLKDAKDSGAPVNQGATPVIERDKSGWLGL